MSHGKIIISHGMIIFIEYFKHNSYIYIGIEFYLFVSHRGMNDRGSTCKFRNAWSAFRNLQWILCPSYLHEKQTSRIQSLYLYFINIVLFWLWNICFLLHNRAVFRTAAGAAYSYITLVACLKNGCQNFSYVYWSRKHWKQKYLLTKQMNVFTICLYPWIINIINHLISILLWT